MADPLNDADLAQTEQRAIRALEAAPPPWIPETETRAGTGGCSFIRIGADPEADEEIYLDVQTSRGEMTSPDAQLDSVIEFVACAPGDVMRLITEVRRLRG